MKLKTIIAASLAVVALNATAQTKKTVAKPTPKATAPVANALKTNMDSVSYSLGINIAQSLKMQNMSDVNVALLTKAMNESLKKDGKVLLNDQAALAVLNTHFQKMQAAKTAEAAKSSEPNRKAGEAFLAENKKKTDVVTLPSGMQYQIMKMGDGPKPLATDKVRTHYHGTLIDGTVFDSSVDRGQPAEFPVGGVIQGWVEALQLMPVGSKWKLFIPYNLAYGERSAGAAIKPYSALVFEVELLEILK